MLDQIPAELVVAIFQYVRGHGMEPIIYGTCKYFLGILKTHFKNDHWMRAHLHQAIVKEHIKVAQWLHDAGIRLQVYTFSRVIKMEQVKSLAWLLDNGYKSQEDLYLSVVNNRQTAIMDLLLTYGIRPNGIGLYLRWRDKNVDNWFMKYKIDLKNI